MVEFIAGVAVTILARALYDDHQRRALDKAIERGKQLDIKDTEPVLTEKQQRGRVKRGA